MSKQARRAQCRAKEEEVTTAAVAKPAPRKRMTVAELKALLEERFDALDARIKRLEGLEEDPTEPIVVVMEGAAEEDLDDEDEDIYVYDLDNLPRNDPYDVPDGPRTMWKFKDALCGIYRGPVPKINVALAAVGYDATQVQAVNVWIRDGVIDHIMTPEEVEKYLS